VGVENRNEMSKWIKGHLDHLWILGKQMESGQMLDSTHTQYVEYNIFLKDNVTLKIGVNSALPS